MSPDHRTSPFTRLRLPTGFRWLLLAWLVAETVVFAVLVRTLGLGGTLLLGIATTVLGVGLLRRLGLGAMRGLRQAAEGTTPSNGALPDGLLAALGAVLLIVPGFLANLAGLTLTAPSARRALLRRFGDGRGTALRRPSRVDVIDLGPGEWTPVDRA